MGGVLILQHVPGIQHSARNTESDPFVVTWANEKPRKEERERWTEGRREGRGEKGEGERKSRGREERGTSDGNKQV
jgi:hypothetical protein